MINFQKVSTDMIQSVAHQQSEAVKYVKNYKYSLTDQIGQGFSSHVYKGTNTLNGLPVAIKVIELKNIKSEVENLLLANELRALGQLKHENIIEAVDICQTANNVYIVTEYCNKGDLASHLKNRGRIGEEEALGILKQITAGMVPLMNNGILHRDIKTANILIKDGVMKIADFGFCDFLHESRGKNLKYNVGSPLYMSPQAYKKSSYSFKSQIWALGIILYELLLGQQPFKGIDYETMIKTIASGEIYNNISVSGFTKMVLSRLLAIDISRRVELSQLISLLNQPRTSEAIGMPRPIHIPSVPLTPPSHLGRTSALPSNRNEIILSRPTSLVELNQSAPINNKNFESWKLQPAAKENRIPLEQLTIDQVSARNYSTLGSQPNFEKKKTAPLPTISQSTKKSFYLRDERPQLTGSQKPQLISFESHLSSYSTTNPELNKASEKLLVSKFLYRLCKLLSQTQSVNKQHARRLLLLLFKHLEDNLRNFESQNYFFVAESSQQSAYTKMVAKLQEYKASSKNEFTHDEYFCFVLSEGIDNEPIYRYIQFWCRLTLKDIGEKIQFLTNNLTIGFGSYDVQHLFTTYRYVLKYYEFLEAIKKRSVVQGVPESLKLGELLVGHSNVSGNSFIELCHQAKVLVK